MFEKSKWIKAISNTKTEFYDQSPAPYIARSFELADEVAKATLNICGLGEAAYFLNGKIIPDSYRPTAWTNVLKNVTYNVFDVTDILHKGRNRFTAILGNMHASRPESSITVSPQLIMQLDVELKNGEKISVVSDKNFRTADSPIVFSSACSGEIYDATREIPGCTDAEFDDNQWNIPVISCGPGGEFRTTKMPPIRKIREIPGKEISPKVFDFGEVTAGYVRAKITGKRGNTVKLKYSERLLDDGHVNMCSFSQWKYPDMMNSDMYVLDGTPEKVFDQYFSIHGFRYVEVEGEYESIELTAVVAHTDMQKVSDFKCDNEIINKIHSACLNSILTCTQGTMMDNPRRDLPWLGDIMLSCEANVINFDTCDLFDKILVDCMDEQRPSGLMPWGAPSMFPEWEQRDLIGPDWGDSVMFHLPYYTYLYTGNDSLIKKTWKNMNLSLEYYKHLSDDYIICGDVGTGDWSAIKSGCSKEITNTAFFYWSAVMTGEMAEVIGEDAKCYAELANNIKQSFRAKYVSCGKMTANHISELIIPAYVGLLEGDEIRDAVERISSEIENSGYAFTFGVLGLRMVFDLLCENGKGQLIYDTVVNDKVFGYAQNVQNGFKTLPEFFNPEHSLLLSHNHHFFAMVDSWFYKWIAGIRYEDFGERNLVINPLLLKDIKQFSANVHGVKVDYCDGRLTVDSPKPFTLIQGGNETKYTWGHYSFKC